MSTTERTAIDTAWSVADMQEIDDDLDAIREVDTDADGVTVRVLLHDGESEHDQVGFEATRPQGHMAGELFRDSLRNGMRELKSYMRTGSTNTADTVDESTDDSEDSGEAEMEEETGKAVIAETSEEDPRNEGDQQTNVRGSEHEDHAYEHQVSTVSFDVTLDDDALEDVRAELSDALAEINDEMAQNERVEELEETVDLLETRLTNLEQQLSMLGSTDI